MTIATYELSRIIEALQVMLTACRTLKGMRPKGCDMASHVLDGAIPSDCLYSMTVSGENPQGEVVKSTREPTNDQET